MGQSLHLVGRFLASLRPGPPPPDDEAWASSLLLPGEQDLWDRLSNPDRRHGVGVARAVLVRWPEARGVEAVAATPPRAVLAAALLHDVGKTDARMRTPARVVATLVWAVLDDSIADRWLADGPTGPRGRLASYRRHPEIGGRLLRSAGSDQLTSAWAEEHHRPPDGWSVEPHIGRLLKECDDD